MDRFDDFLQHNLPKYLENDLVVEVIVTDENGNDYVKLQSFQHPKLRIYKNTSILGPLLNKLEACKYATQDWIAVIDSDNFANTDYFETAKQYIEQHSPNLNSILAPSWARPNFDYRHLSGFIYKKGSFELNRSIEDAFNRGVYSEVLMNTGNYILHRHLYTKFVNSSIIKREQEREIIQNSSACDVIYFNTLLFEHCDLELHVVPDMFYTHIVHGESIYMKTHRDTSNCIDQVHFRYRALK